jgi:hypothetical protein
MASTYASHPFQTKFIAVFPERRLEPFFGAISFGFSRRIMARHWSFGNCSKYGSEFPLSQNLKNWSHLKWISDGEEGEISKSNHSLTQMMSTPLSQGDIKYCELRKQDHKGSWSLKIRARFLSVDISERIYPHFLSYLGISGSIRCEAVLNSSGCPRTLTPAIGENVRNSDEFTRCAMVWCCDVWLVSVEGWMIRRNDVKNESLLWVFWLVLSDADAFEWTCDLMLHAQTIPSILTPNAKKTDIWYDTECWTQPCDIPFILLLLNIFLFNTLVKIHPSITSFDLFLPFGTPFRTPLESSQKKSEPL